MDQDQIPTQIVRELPNKRRRDDVVTSTTLIIFIGLDIILRVVQIIMTGEPQ